MCFQNRILQIENTRNNLLLTIFINIIGLLFISLFCGKIFQSKKQVITCHYTNIFPIKQEWHRWRFALIEINRVARKLWT